MAANLIFVHPGCLRRNPRPPRPHSGPDQAAPLEFSHGRNEPVDVLRAREAVIAVLDEREHNVLARDARAQFSRMLPWHVGILHALQDANRAAGLNHAAEQKMLPSLLNQPARDWIGPVAVGGRPLPGALLLDR